MTGVMHQTAPWPDDLERLVQGLRHRPTWSTTLVDNYDRGQGCIGLTVVVYITEPDAYHPEQQRSVIHLFPVPAAAYDYRSWRHWLLIQLNSISFHEDMEQFTIDGEKPYAPSHGPGSDPYILREIGTEIDRRTSFRGELNE